MILDTLTNVLTKNALLTAFAFVGLIVWFSYWLSEKTSNGQVHGSAVAIALGLLLAYVGGRATGGSQGIADVSVLAGVGVMGGAMFRDFAIVATAFGAHIDELKKAGAAGALSVVIGVVLSFVVGALVAVLFRVHRSGGNQHDRSGSGNLHRRPGDRNGARRGLWRHRTERCRWADEIGVGHDWHSAGGGAHRPEQSVLCDDLRWADGNDQWSRRRARGNGSQARSLRRDDGDVLHGRWLPACALSSVSNRARGRLRRGNQWIEEALWDMRRALAP